LGKCQLTESRDAAVQIYETTTGGSLRRVVTYGVDPLEGNNHLQELRKQKFYETFKSNQDIFSAVVQMKKAVFESAIAYFQNLTIDLSRRV